MQIRWIGRRALVITWWAAGVLAPLLLFGAVAEDVHEQEALWFDHLVQAAVHARASPLLDTLVYWTTNAGSALALVPADCLVFGWLWRQRRRADATFWAAAVLGTAALNLAAKHFFARMRPDLWVSRVHETTCSFPSGHAMSSMAAAAALCVLLWPTRWRWAALAAATSFVCAVGVSRVYLGVHYPSDVLAGWAASLAWVAGARLLLDQRALGEYTFHR